MGKCKYYKSRRCHIPNRSACSKAFNKQQMSLVERDFKVIWHPYTQMKTALPPVPIVRGEGACLYDENGKRYIDAVSSWWVNIHGHAHPYIAQIVAEQLKKLE